MKQEDISQINQSAWNHSAYQAWTNRYGSPGEYAKKLKENPAKKVAHYLKFMGDIKGKKIANLLGSNGNKAVSFALLGADVTVVDFSQENRRYAVDLAKEANVDINYIVSDVLTIPEEESLSDFDFVLLELGVLHYFVDLSPLLKIIDHALKPGGKFLLRDYHPFTSKVLQVENNNMIVNGSYFDAEVVEEDVAYSMLLEEKDSVELKKVKIRRWTLGEIITAISTSGLIIKSVEEESGMRWALPAAAPLGIENNIPGLYTLIAQK